MYQHLFGPVPSRRLGMSLGVDLIPHKICSLNCVYCECGPTTRLTRERKAYVPADEVYRELEDFFQKHPDPDYITFSGAGEPTLHVQIGDVISFLKELRPQIPLAVLTNGTTLSDPQVRRELMQSDLVLPSLDAATSLALKKINRPPASIQPETYIQGLVDFAEEFQGEIWLEIFLLPHFNDDEDNLNALKKAIFRIGPDRVQLNTLDRPGAVEGLHPMPHERLEEIAAFFDREGVEIIAAPPKRKESKAYRDDVENAILETIARRPCTLQDLEKLLGRHMNEINKYLGVLEERGEIESVEQERGSFYQLKTPPSG